MRCSYAVSATMIPGRVMETERFKLNCSVITEDTDKIKEHLWKSCVWTRNSDGAKCSQIAIKPFVTTKESCDTSLVDVELGSSKPLECAISITSASVSDRGNWTCKLKKCKDIEDGGCSSEESSACMAEANVKVKVFIKLLEDRCIPYTESKYQL